MIALVNRIGVSRLVAAVVALVVFVGLVVTFTLSGTWAGVDSTQFDWPVF